MCSLYAIGKLSNQISLKFKQIMVVHQGLSGETFDQTISSSVNLTPDATPTGGGSSDGSADVATGATGSLVDFYNKVFVPTMKSFLIGAKESRMAVSLLGGGGGSGSGSGGCSTNSASAAAFSPTARAPEAGEYARRAVGYGTAGSRSPTGGGQKWQQLTSSPRTQILYSFPESPLHKAGLRSFHPFPHTFALSCLFCRFLP
jgi:hypothetical protein